MNHLAKYPLLSLLCGVILGVVIVTIYNNTLVANTGERAGRVAGKQAAAAAVLDVQRQVRLENIRVCRRVTRPNRSRSDLRATLNADAWKDNWLSKRTLAKINRAEGQYSVAAENENLARKLHHVELALRVPLLNPPCAQLYRSP